MSPTKKLAGLIAKRHLCLSQLRDLGLKQSALIHAGEINSLLRLIGAKNQIIAALHAVEKELAPFHEQDPESRQWESPEARAQCAAQAAQCTKLLEEVMQLERNNEEIMTKRRDQVAEQLQVAQAANAARGAYQAQQKWNKTSVPAPHIQPPVHGTGIQNQLDLHSEA